MNKIFLLAISLFVFSVSFCQSPVSDFVKCQNRDTGYTSYFDLNEKNDEILNGRSPSDFTISYHYSQAEATTGTNPVTQIIELQYSQGQQTIFYRLEDNNNTTSVEIESFNLRIIRTEVRMDEDFYCGNSEGYYQFQLANLDDGMLNHQYPPNDQDPAIHEVSYYLTEDDAENQVNPLDKNSWTNTIPDEQTLYVRVQRTDEYACHAIKFFIIYVARTIQNPQVGDEEFCTDQDPAAFNYDLSNKNQEILNGADENEFNITYYYSETDAINRNSEIGQVNGAELPRKIFYRLEDNMFSGCFETGNFNLDMEKGVQAKEPAPIQVCDLEESGTYSLNLAEKDVEILDGQDPDNYEVTYFRNKNEALEDVNTLPKQNYQAQTGNTTLYARLSPKNEGCSSIVKMEIMVSPLPQPRLEENYTLCEESTGVSLDGGDFESWDWLGPDYETIGSERNITINEPGDYGLSVTKTINGVTCQNTVFFEIENSSGMGEITYSINGADNDRRLNVKTVNSEDLEYSLDGTNFQDSSEFPISEGNYTLVVRDRDGCAEASIPVIVPGYQSFFTPNGDGVNDKWEIVVTENGTFLDVLIYDRYGKLLAQILSGKNGWDGTHNGQPMPSDDYWFSVEYSNGEILTGHFSLVRS